MFIKNRSHSADESSGSPDVLHRMPKATESIIFATLDENIAFIHEALGVGIGLIVKRYAIFKSKLQICLVYVDAMADQKTIGAQIIEPLINESEDFSPGRDDIIKALLSRVSFPAATEVSDRMEEVLKGLLNGSSILLIQQESRALIFDSKIALHRTIEKPENEASMLCSLDSLTEDIDSNCNLITKRLPHPDLKFHEFTVGKLSQTTLKLLWVEGIADLKTVDEAKNRIGKIDIDNIEGIGALSELIRDRPLSIFPTYKQTQRPDVIARCLTDGQFAILCDNSPYAFIAPVSFWDQFKTADDYAQNTFISSYLRFIRYLSFVLCTTISPLYLACVAYNHNIVPPNLAIDIAIGRDGVPFPSVIEIVLLTITISVIREASLRIPGPTGYFIGTMSAIVIGQATVAAGYVSASVIIVVSISVISSYAVSSSILLYTTRLINYFLILLAGFFGMYGLINGIVIIIWHMVSLKSFGMPYLYPLVPFDREALKDTIIRAPLSTLKKRFGVLAPTNRTRTSYESRTDTKG